MNLSITMTRRETQLGWCYLLLYLFAIPMVINFVGTAFALSLSVLNILFFFVNFACVVWIFRRFLWKSIKAFCEKPLKNLRFVLTGMGVHFVCTLLVSVIITPWIAPDFSNVNDDAIIEISNTHTLLFGFCAVVLAPVVEEMLFRGLVFGTIYEKRPRLALCVSVLLFSSIHLFEYIGTTDWKTLFVCFIQYLPAGLALAGSYAVSGNIVTPTLIHIINNAIAMAVLR